MAPITGPSTHTFDGVRVTTRAVIRTDAVPTLLEIDTRWSSFAGARFITKTFSREESFLVLVKDFLFFEILFFPDFVI